MKNKKEEKDKSENPRILYLSRKLLFAINPLNNLCRLIRNLLAEIVKATTNKEKETMSNSEETTKSPTQIQKISIPQEPSRAQKANKEFEGIKKALIGSTPEDQEQKTWVLPTPELKTNFSKPSLNANHCKE